MSLPARRYLVALAAFGTVALGTGAGCSPHKARSAGRIVAAVTVDWEGAALAPEGLDALDELRKHIGSAPITHFVSAAYFTKDHPDPRAAAYLSESIHPGDELAVHLHAWRSLATAAGIAPKLSPSFVSGTDKLAEFDDGDIGFDTDLDVYGVPELRALVRTSARLLEQTHRPVSKVFRAGGYLGTPKMLDAIRLEGFAVDSSATDSHQVDSRKDSFLSRRVREVWPKVDETTQPFLVDPQSRQLIEMPIAATADYVTTGDIVHMFEAAGERLTRDPEHDVFVVLACNQETAQDFAAVLGAALEQVRGRAAIADHLLLTTVENAAALARNAIAPGA